MNRFQITTPTRMLHDATLIVANENKTVRSLGMVIDSQPTKFIGQYKTTIEIKDIPRGLVIPAELPATLVFWIVRNYIPITRIGKTIWRELFDKLDKNEEVVLMEILKFSSPDQLINELSSQTEQLQNSNNDHNIMINELQKISLDLLKSCIPLLRTFVNDNCK